MVPIFGENPIEIIVDKLFQLDFAQIVTKKLIDKKNLYIFLISSNTIQYCFFCEFLAFSLDLWTLLTCNPWGGKERNSYESKISLIVYCAKTNTIWPETSALHNTQKPAANILLTLFGMVGVFNLELHTYLLTICSTPDLPLGTITY